MMQSVAPSSVTTRDVDARSNALLARLSQDVMRALAPRMTVVSWAPGDLLCRSGEGLDAAYFPFRGMISGTLEATGSAADACVIGREGFAAPAALLDVSCPYRLTAQTPGRGIAIEAALLRRVIRDDRAAEEMFHRFAHVLSLQVACAAIAHATERLDARLSRWLLMCADRVGPLLPVVHSDISKSLGVRRAGVTLAIHMLESEGVVRARRKRIEVLNRAKLLRRAGRSYGVAEEEYERLLGRSESASVPEQSGPGAPAPEGAIRWTDGRGEQPLRQGAAGPFQTCAQATRNAELKELFVHGLKALYFAETAIAKALPRMIDAAENASLKSALSKHRDETTGHVERLEKAFRAIDVKTQPTPCEAMKGILREGDAIVERFGKSAAADAAIIFACQAVEHYEITRYGSLREWAETLGLKDVASILKETLDEEYAADDKLTALARQEINRSGGGRRPEARAH